MSEIFSEYLHRGTSILSKTRYSICITGEQQPSLMLWAEGPCRNTKSAQTGNGSKWVRCLQILTNMQQKYWVHAMDCQTIALRPSQFILDGLFVFQVFGLASDKKLCGPLGTMLCIWLNPWYGAVSHKSCSKRFLQNVVYRPSFWQCGGI